MTILNSYAAGPQQPKSLVVLLHGYGANGQDLIGLAPEWQADLPDTLFLAPDAPDMCEINPAGRQWFSLEDKSYANMQAGAAAAVQALDEYIDALQAQLSLPASKIALVGFSQGTMMSLYLAPRRTEAFAGVLGYSGLLLGIEELMGETAPTRCPVCLVHGDDDMVVDVGAFDHAMLELERAGFAVTGHKLRGLGHGINEAGLEIGREFLCRVLG